MIATMAAAAPTLPESTSAERGPLVRLALFAALLAAVAGVAALVGVAVGDRIEIGSTSAGSHGEEMAGSGGEDGASGLAIVSHGEYLAVFTSTRFSRSETDRISFRVLDAEGAPVTDMDEHGGVRMHLIVVRRDFEGYQHLHPTLAADGSWQTDLRLPEAGVYRAFADFERDGEKVVLGTDLFAAGEFDPTPLPPASSVATVDGYDVDGPSIELARRNAEDAGIADRVRFHVRDAGAEELAGAYHLVTVFEAIHDLSQPVAVLAAMRRLAAEDGTVLVMDERVADAFAAPGDEVERLMYTYSILCCLPAGLADTPSAATGTVMRTDTLRRYAEEAGYAGLEVLPIEHEVFRFYRLHP